MNPEPFRRQPRTAPSPARPGTEEGERLAQLRDMLANLTDFIEKEAEKLAGPLIEDAAEKAREVVAEAERETQRQRDLVAELRRRLEPLQRFADENRDAVTRLAAALGYRYPSGHWLPSLVADIEARLAKESKD
jgi:hypothetical protein